MVECALVENVRSFFFLFLFSYEIIKSQWQLNVDESVLNMPCLKTTNIYRIDIVLVDA